MAHIVLAVKNDAEQLKKKLDKNLSGFADKSYKIKIEEDAYSGWPHFLCAIDKKGRTSQLDIAAFRQRAADAVTDFIVGCQCSYYLSEALTRRYFYFSRREQEEILCLAKKNENKYCKEEEMIREEIKKRVLNCLLLQQDYLNVHGLVAFRLKPWHRYLKKRLDDAVDKFLIEKEYREFVKLLQYFVGLQEPKVNKIHVLLDEEGNLCLQDHVDGEKNTRDAGREESEWHDLFGDDQEDLLVSTIVTVAPQKVVLHRQVDLFYPRAADTLRQVFEGRLIICDSCEMCLGEGIKPELKKKR